MKKHYVFLSMIFISQNLFSQTFFYEIGKDINGAARPKILSLEKEKDITSLFSDESPEMALSNLYSQTLNCIKVPAIHAYNPASSRLMAVELPSEMKECFPQNAYEIFSQNFDLASIPHKFKFFLSVELMDTESLLLRPHYYIFRNAFSYNEKANYSEAKNVHASLFNFEGTQIPLDNKGLGFPVYGISAHAGKVSASGNDIVASPNNMNIVNPNLLDDVAGFYSCVFIEEKEALSYPALTYHLLLKMDAYQEMKNVSDQCDSAENFMLAIHGSDFSALPEIQQFITLFQTGLSIYDSKTQ